MLASSAMPETIAAQATATDPTGKVQLPRDHQQRLPDGDDPHERHGPPSSTAKAVAAVSSCGIDRPENADEQQQGDGDAQFGNGQQFAIRSFDKAHGFSHAGNVALAEAAGKGLPKAVVERHPGSRPAVDDQHLPDDIAGVVGKQEGGHPGDV